MSGVEVDFGARVFLDLGDGEAQQLIALLFGSGIQAVGQNQGIRLDHHEGLGVLDACCQAGYPRAVLAGWDAAGGMVAAVAVGNVVDDHDGGGIGGLGRGGLGSCCLAAVTAPAGIPGGDGVGGDSLDFGLAVGVLGLHRLGLASGRRCGIDQEAAVLDRHLLVSQCRAGRVAWAACQGGCDENSECEQTKATHTSFSRDRRVYCCGAEIGFAV